MQASVVHRDFSNVGFAGRRRAFPGFPAPSSAHIETLGARCAASFELRSGDLLSVRPLAAGQSAQLLVFDDEGRLRPDIFRLSGDALLTPDTFDCPSLRR